MPSTAVGHRAGEPELMSLMRAVGCRIMVRGQALELAGPKSEFKSSATY